MKNLLVDRIGNIFRVASVRTLAYTSYEVKFELSQSWGQSPRFSARVSMIEKLSFRPESTPAVRNVPNDIGSVTGRIRIVGLSGEGMAGLRMSTMPLKVLVRAKGQRCNVRQLYQPSVGIGKPLREDVQKVKRNDRCAFTLDHFSQWGWFRLTHSLSACSLC